jgi:hypothetical protein
MDLGHLTVETDPAFEDIRAGMRRDSMRHLASMRMALLFIHTTHPG